jgi:hypothetical protein
MEKSAQSFRCFINNQFLIGRSRTHLNRDEPQEQNSVRVEARRVDWKFEALLLAAWSLVLLS